MDTQTVLNVASVVGALWFGWMVIRGPRSSEEGEGDGRMRGEEAEGEGEETDRGHNRGAV